MEDPGLHRPLLTPPTSSGASKKECLVETGLQRPEREVRGNAEHTRE